MIKLRSMRFSRSNSKLNNGGGPNKSEKRTERSVGEIRWELRPGGMLVQKREFVKGEGLITVKVSTVSLCHDVSIGATSTFGELKMVLSLISGLEPSEQRLIYRGKEREDEEHLHMVGVGHRDKVLLLEDPALKDRKLRAFIKPDLHCPTIRV